MTTITRQEQDLEEARADLDTLTGHLGHTDTAWLTRHLRGTHGKVVHAGNEDCLYLLAADHETAHAADLAAARNQVAAAEDAAWHATHPPEDPS